MIELICEECRRTIRVRPSWKAHRFCSWQCDRESRRRGYRISFWSKVLKSGPVIRAELGPCWVWTGIIGATDGYGRYSKRLAHREAWALSNGPIVAGLFVLHRCDNRACVNPSHLFLGTHADNMRDMVAKGRQHAGPGVPKGTSQKLSASDVFEIRAIAAAGMKQKAIASRFSITQSAVSRIVSRSSWSHV